MSQGRQAKPGYRPQTEDTSIEADVYLFNRIRQLTLQQRVDLAIAQDKSTRRLCLTGIKWRHPSAPQKEIRDRFAHAVLASKFPLNFQPTSTDEAMWIQDSITLAQNFHQILEAAGIMYYVSGGVASSIHGEARSTRDLDLVIQVQQHQINSLVTTLQSEGFYCLESAVEEVKQLRSRILNITFRDYLKSQSHRSS